VTRDEQREKLRWWLAVHEKAKAEGRFQHAERILWMMRHIENERTEG